MNGTQLKNTENKIKGNDNSFLHRCATNGGIGWPHDKTHPFKGSYRQMPNAAINRHGERNYINFSHREM